MSSHTIVTRATISFVPVSIGGAASAWEADLAIMGIDMPTFRLRYGKAGVNFLFAREWDGPLTLLGRPRSQARRLNVFAASPR
ncbi:MAG: hypothetical protein ACJ8DN_07965, partial [Microvirga sp.]